MFNITLFERVEQIAKFIFERFSESPKSGIVLGTGSGIVASEIDIAHSFDYEQLPNFPVSTALGHNGRLILGTLNGVSVVAMDGRFHLYEGHSVDDATIGIRVMRRLGVEKLFVTNASGGLNPQYNSGEIMIIDSHIDLMCRTSLNSSLDVTCQRPSCRADVYDRDLSRAALACGRRHDFIVHKGVYGALLGPNYETRAEYRMLRRIGCDVAGMSTVPEVNIAAKLGIHVLGLSIVTNVAKPDVLKATSGHEVIDAAQVAAPCISKIIQSTMNRT